MTLRAEVAVLNGQVMMTTHLAGQDDDALERLIDLIVLIAVNVHLWPLMLAHFIHMKVRRCLRVHKTQMIRLKSANADICIIYHEYIITYMST